MWDEVLRRILVSHTHMVQPSSTRLQSLEDLTLEKRPKTSLEWCPASKLPSLFSFTQAIKNSVNIFCSPPFANQSVFEGVPPSRPNEKSLVDQF